MLSGYRAKLGVIPPAGNTVVEAEFQAMAPEGVSIHASRIAADKTPEDTAQEAMSKFVRDIDRTVKELSIADVDVIAFCCTTASFYGGHSWNKDITERMARVTKAKVLTTSTAVVDALRFLKIRKIAVATPYTNDINLKLKTFLESQDFEVINLKGLGLPGKSVSKQHPEVIYKLAKRLFQEDLEGLFISCTAFRAINIIEMLERDLSIPVVTSNQATMWASLKLAMIGDRIEGFGSLFHHEK